MTQPPEVHVSKVSYALLCVLVMGAPPPQESVTLTTTADFDRGNNEGLISTADDRLTRDRVTGGAAGPWSATSQFPLARSYVEAAAFNGYVYVTGGIGPGAYYHSYAYNDVFVGSLGKDGSIGAWRTLTPSTAGGGGHRCVAYNGYLYMMGGRNTIGEGIRDVAVARIQDDGSLGAWAAATPLPPTSGLSSFAAVAHDGRLYVIGGLIYSSPVADVHVAPIRADGTLGEWSAVTSLPTATSKHDSVAYNGHLYVLGGDDPNPWELSRVIVATINADGSLGAWSSTTSLPTPCVRPRAVAYNGFLYSIGGDRFSGGPLGDVLVAPLNDDGSVGDWSATTAISPPRRGAASIAHAGFLYAIGGTISGQGYTTEVLVASILGDVGQSPDILRGFYSSVVDLKGDSSTRYVTLNGGLSPAGVIRLQVRVAPESSGIFGPETVFESVAPGSTVEVPGNGRYVWIRLTLDDTGTGDVDQPTYVSDIAITPGADIDAQPGDDDDNSCAFGVSPMQDPALSVLAGLVLVAWALRRMRSQG
jgi:N-acetylneuraminic acid mutarotase